MLALLGVSAGCVFRGILVGVSLIMSFEVEYCLTANSVICHIYERFVEFCFFYWTEFAFYSVGTRLVVAWSTRGLVVSTVSYSGAFYNLYDSFFNNK